MAEKIWLSFGKDDAGEFLASSTFDSENVSPHLEYAQYLRADTCTPNAELEELLNDWKVRYKFKPEADKTLADCIRELREVMK